MYRVEWIPSAALRFADLWLPLSPEQQGAVIAALTVFKRALTSDPLGHGESREHGNRIMLESPLGILYRVERAGYMVSILRVWRF